MKCKLDKQIVFLLFLNLLLFLPSLFEPISYGDECIYLTLGQALRKGSVFYRDIHDNKPPLLYFLAAASFGRLSLLRAFNLVFNLFHLGLVYYLAKKLTKNRLASFFAGLSFTILYLLFEGKTANGEMFMMVPATLAVYLLLEDKKAKNFRKSCLIGCLFAIGFLFKIPLAFDFAGIIFAYYFLPLKKISLGNLRKVFGNRQLIGNLLGFSMPILASIVYYAAKGAFTPYVRSALLQNIGYLSSWQGSGSDLIIKFGLTAAIALIILVLRKSISKNFAFFGLWFVFALFGALLSGRPYPHYLIETVPSLSILIALAWSEKKFKNIAITTAAFGLLLTGYSYYRFWYYPILPYYKNFFLFVSGRISQKQYLSFWGEKTANDYRLARLIKEHTLPTEPVFIWGDGACAYAIADRLPTGKYTVNYHIFDFNGFEETLNSIKDKKPKVIVKLNGEKTVWPELNQLLFKDYRLFLYPEISDRVFLLKRN
ncbi:MAG: glycosyltransferase family 39 protein [Patescibacteria group bacterium]|nr:glycosyltransferase family 39 protein [Patescibacteria group bacterium]